MTWVLMPNHEKPLSFHNKKLLNKMKNSLKIDRGKKYQMIRINYSFNHCNKNGGLDTYTQP